MENFPISNKYKYILCSWLVSGVVVRGKDYEPTETGVPQGGIISPVISNFVLDGLEECVYNSIQAVTSRKCRTKEFRGSITNDIIIKRFNIQFIRYADDFIITCRSMYIAKEYIKPKIINFLKERGV
jgi:RNA-directed DNA polymerase